MGAYLLRPFCMKGRYCERDNEKTDGGTACMYRVYDGGSGALPASKGRLCASGHGSRDSRRADTAVAVYCIAEYGGGDQPERDVPGQI